MVCVLALVYKLCKEVNSSSPLLTASLPGESTAHGASVRAKVQLFCLDPFADRGKRPEPEDCYRGELGEWPGAQVRAALSFVYMQVLG